MWDTYGTLAVWWMYECYYVLLPEQRIQIVIKISLCNKLYFLNFLLFFSVYSITQFDSNRYLSSLFVYFCSPKICTVLIYRYIYKRVIMSLYNKNKLRNKFKQNADSSLTWVKFIVHKMLIKWIKYDFDECSSYKAISL